MSRSSHIISLILQFAGVTLIVMVLTALLCTLFFPSEKSPPPAKLYCNLHLVNPDAKPRDQIWSTMCEDKNAN